MRTVLAIALFLTSSFAWAAAKPDPAECPIVVHVVSSHLEKDYSGGVASIEQVLDVVIDGQKYELIGNPVMVAATRPGTIVPSDYKARVLQEKRKGNYAYSAEYEILFPDQTTEKFDVIGESE